MLNMTQKTVVAVMVLGSMMLTGCGVTTAFKEAKEAVSYAFSSQTPTEALDAYEQEVNKTYPSIAASKVDDKTTARINADNQIKRNSAMAKKCSELIAKLPPLNTEKNDADQIQQRENLETREAAYLTALTEVCNEAATKNLAVSIPTGSKFLSPDHGAYDPIRNAAATASKK